MNSDNRTRAQTSSVMRSLRNLGADVYDLLLPETHSLPRILMPDEIVEGVVYGRYIHSNDKPPGRGTLVATDRRILLIDRKPFYMNTGEIAYDVVSGVDYGNTGFVSAVTLNTRMGHITIRTFNPNAATTFVRAIENRIFTPSRGNRSPQ